MKKGLVVLILSFFLLSSSLFGLWSVPQVSATSHDPITIDGNSQFVVGVNGVVSGSGTEIDPYVIENWEISAVSAIGIYIQNTDAFFVIRDCVLSEGSIGGWYGVRLENVMNGRIESNEFSGTYSGVDLLDSDFIVVANNNLSNNDYGIALGSLCANCTLTGNTVSSSLQDGVRIDGSSNNTVTNNTVTDSGEYGIQLYASSNNTITDNEVGNSARDGILIYWDSINNNVTNNRCYNNTETGIYVYVGSSFNNVVGNNVTGSTGSGIYIDTGSHNNTIISNMVINSSLGIGTSFSQNNTFTSNTVLNNSYCGISVDSSSNSTLTDNTIGFNSMGVYIGFSETDNTVLLRNSLYNNTQGIYSGGSNVQIAYCLIYNNTDYGVHTESYDPVVNATYNWWGSADGPSDVASGHGDGVSDNVLYDPWLTLRDPEQTVHSVIYINGNAQFTEANGVVGGSGTELDPYVIEHWRISAVGLGDGIWITNTDAFFVVRNCSATTAGVYNGIYLTNVKNGRIESNAFYNNQRGIYLSSASTNNTVVNNTCIYSSDRGILVDATPAHNLPSDNNTLIGNVVYGNLYGIYIDYSSNITLTNNNIFNNINHGIFLSSTSNDTLSGNTIGYQSSVNSAGIYSSSSGSNKFFGNIIADNVFGIQLASSSSNVITGNMVYNCSDTGIYLMSPGNYNNLTNNICYNNTRGIQLYTASRNIVTGNTVFNNTNFGIGLISTSQYNILNNNTAFNNPIGVVLQSSGSNILSWSNVSYNSNIGIKNTGATNITVNYCSIQGNTNYGVNTDTNSVNATYNWWGASNGPGTVGPGSGDHITSNVLYNPWIASTPGSNPTLISHAPITIVGNSQFTTANGVVSGSGTEGSPYIIEKWAISSSSSYGIYIVNTNAFFIIRDCSISGNDNLYGIFLSYVVNGKVEGNTISHNSEGILLEDSADNTITDNTVDNCDYGIDVAYSSHNVIDDNVVDNSGVNGITVNYDSLNNTLIGNTIGNTLNKGIVISSSNNTLTNNTVFSSTFVGISIEADNATLINNSASSTHSGDGIRLSSSYNHILINNNASSNYQVGINLQSSSNNRLTENVAHSNGQGISLYNSNSNTLDSNNADSNIYLGINVNGDNNVLLNNNASQNLNCIVIDSSNNNTLTGNVALNGDTRGIVLSYGGFHHLSNNILSGEGIYIDSSSYNVISGNTITGSDEGIYLTSSINNTVSGNNLTGNNYGIQLIGSSNNTLAENIVVNNPEGIYIQDSSDNNTLTGNIISNNFHGIYLQSASFNTLTGNTIANNTFGMILFSQSANNNVTQCLIHDNTNYGIYNFETDSAYIVDARNNWWGSADGPSGAGPGNGDAINQNVLYDPWLKSSPSAEISFDFGTDSSPLETGWIRVLNTTAYSTPLGYGWSSTVNLVSRDRGEPDSLRRDFVFGNRTEGTFKVDLPNGEYQVIVIIGDQSFTHDLIDVYAEDVLKINDLTVAAGSFQEVAFVVTITDGQLNLRFIDDGGVDPNWVLNALRIRIPPPLPTSASFDFGTPSSPTNTGYTQVSYFTSYSALSGYGWSNTAGLDSRDRGAPNDLCRDLIFSSTEGIFNVDLANGEYMVTVTIGDQDYTHDLIDVYAEGALMINDLTATSGSFEEVSFRVTVADEQLNVRIIDDGGVDANWVINALTIVEALPLPTSGLFDFGTSSSVVEPTYTQVTGSTAYSAITGYGWSSIEGLDSRDRGSPDDLRMDLVFSPTENTFNVDLANGDYQITVTIGDQDYTHDQIDIYAENTLKISGLTATAGTFQQETFTVTIADGQCNLRILDNGGTDPNWVINAIAIVEAPS